MTNKVNYGWETTDAVDYRQQYRELIKDVAQWNQGGLPQNLMAIVKRTRKEKAKSWLKKTSMALQGEGDQVNWQKGGFYERIIPLDIYGVGNSESDEFFDDANSDELAQWKQNALRADDELITKQFFATTVGGDSSGTARGVWNGSTTEWTGGTLTGDSSKPADWKNNTFATSHNHYVATGAATLALSDLTTMKEQVTEHGYGLGGKMNCFISQNTAKQIADLAGWTTAMTSNSVVDKISTDSVQTGHTQLGFTFIVDDWMPDDYMYAQSNDMPSVAMREPRNGGGLKFYKGPYEDYPFKESYYKHRLGMVVNNRGGGAVYQITSGSYTSVGTNWTFEA